LAHQTIVAVHAIPGAVYLILAPLQFIGRVRSRHLEYHRWAGRGLVLTGLVVGVTALFIGLVIPFSVWSEAVVIAVFGSLFIFCLFQGFRHIRAKRVDLHREWMIRAFTIALAIASQRVIFIPALLIMGDSTYEQVVFVSVLAGRSRWVCTRSPRRSGSARPDGRVHVRSALTTEPARRGCAHRGERITCRPPPT
jgi:hypothetical protein